MTDTKHTPGPWYILPGEEGVRVRRESDDAVICTISDGDHVNPEHKVISVAGRERNARLIAAAPDLLAALDRAVQDIDAGWANDADTYFPWLHSARAAIASCAIIAKAEGRP